MCGTFGEHLFHGSPGRSQEPSTEGLAGEWSLITGRFLTPVSASQLRPYWAQVGSEALDDNGRGWK